MVQLPKVAHKRPCKECPFRRAAPAGWLGGGAADEWTASLTFGDNAFVCHMAKKKNKNHFCAGSMIFYRNTLKCPRDAEFAAAVAQYEPDAENVFQWSGEFDAHHRNGLLALKEGTKL